MNANIYTGFMDYQKDFDRVQHNKLKKVVEIDRKLTMKSKCSASCTENIYRVS